MEKAPTEGKKQKELAKVLTVTQLNQVRTLADCDMNLSWTARVLGVSRKSMEQQVSRIKKNTGLNPMCFYDLCELLYFDVEKK